MTMSNYFYRAPFYDNELLLLPCSVLWQWVTTFTVLRFMTMSTVLRFMTMSNYFVLRFMMTNFYVLRFMTIVTTFTVLRFMTMSNYFYRAPFYDNE